MAINLKKGMPKGREPKPKNTALVLGRCDAERKARIREQFGRESWAMGYLDELPPMNVRIKLRPGTALVFADENEHRLLRDLCEQTWRTYSGVKMAVYYVGRVTIVNNAG